MEAVKRWRTLRDMDVYVVQRWRMSWDVEVMKI